jgi:hypothetical protein
MPAVALQHQGRSDGNASVRTVGQARRVGSDAMDQGDPAVDVDVRV